MDPFWVALLGGAVGGVVVAFIESFLSRSREHQRWLREERQRKYAELVDAVAAVYTAQDRALDRFRGYSPDSPPSLVYVEIHDELDLLFWSVENALLRLRLVASPRLMNKAEHLSGRAAEMWELLTFANKPPTLQDLYNVELSYDEIEEFIGAARREFGAGRDVITPIRLWTRRRIWQFRRSRLQPEGPTAAESAEAPEDGTVAEPGGDVVDET